MKRERGTLAEVELRTDEQLDEELDESASPSKKNAWDFNALFAAPSKPRSQQLPDYIEKFILGNRALFTDLANAVCPDLLVTYLDHNRASFDYFHQLYQALTAVGTAHRDAQVIYQLAHPFTHEISIKIDFTKLIKILGCASTPEAINLLSVLKEGLHSWRLQKIAALFPLADDNQQTSLMLALNWLESRRHFIQLCLNKDPKLMHWLQQEAQADLRTILGRFTDCIFRLLHEEGDIQLNSVVTRQNTNALIYNQFFELLTYKQPRVMDVRTLWYTLSFKGLVEVDNPVAACHALLSQTNSALLKTNLADFFLSAYPSPWVCFLEAFNGPPASARSEDILKVEKDVLLWLVLSHPDNQSLAPKILARAAGVDKVVAAYERYVSRANSATLATSITSVLQDIHNSPTKQRQQLPPELKRDLAEDSSGLDLSRLQLSPLKKCKN